jgi:Xaa-Pro dipeptidase
MTDLIAEKLTQAGMLVADSGLDVWLTFVRETAEGGDPVLPFLLEGGLTWQSALMVTKSGERVAIVGNYDADPLRASGHWHEVIPYVQSVREPLIETLERLVLADTATPRIGINFSTDDVKADGISYGMVLLLLDYLSGTRFAGCLVSAEEVVSALRAVKTPDEQRRMQAAIVETDRLFAEVTAAVHVGMSERAVYDLVQARIAERGLGYAWDRAGDPIVNSGPDSMIGHGVPSPQITIAPGHVFHIDLGVVVEGYSSDIQRCWYVPHEGETVLPDDVIRAASAVNGAISAGAAVLRPGVAGWQVDEAARNFLTQAGYPDYMHAFGHQVGRVAHDGGAVLGPRWPRYGRTPFLPIRENEVYTLELGVLVEGRGYLGIEEMVVVSAEGCRWLTERQEALWLLR